MPTQADFGGVNVYVSTTSGFTPSTTNLVYSGPDSLITITTDATGAPLVGGVTYYVRIAGYSAHSKANMSYSAQYSVVPYVPAKTATVSLYQWSTGMPSNPSGQSTFTWSTFSNSAYTGAGGWSITAPDNPGTPGLQLYIASKMVSDAATASTTTVSWSSGYTIVIFGVNGHDGTNGVQSAQPMVYQWAATIPAAPSGSPTYTWSTGLFGSAPSGWSLTPGTSPFAGYTLWAAKVNLVASATATTSTFSWTSASIMAIGYAGTSGIAGASYRTAYIASSTASAGTSPNPEIDSGSTTTPSSYWGLSGTWSTTVPTLSAGQYMYQSDGIYNPATNQTAWSIPYWSSLKVGSLSAITVNTGGLNVTGTIQSSTAAIDGTTMTGAGGVLYSSGQFALGNAAGNITYNGSQTTINGPLIYTGNLQDNAATLVQSVYTVGGVGMSISVNPTDVTVQTISVTTIGGQVTILTSMKMAQYTFVANSATFFIKRDGVSVYTREMGTAFEAMIATPYVDSPPAGYHTYTIGFTMTTSQPSCGAYQRFMSIFEARK